MVPQKRIDYGFNGYQVPAIPQRPRSARRRRPSKRNGEDKETSAFDFLASLAGKLLLEGGNSSASNVNTSVDENRCADKQITHKKEPDEDDRLVKVETIDQENGLKEFAVEKLYCCKKSPSSLDSTHLGISSGITMLDSSERSNLQDTVKWGTKNGTGSSSGGSNESLYDETLPMNNQSDNAGKASEHVIIKNEIPLLGPLSSSDKKFICEDSIHRDCFPVTGDCVKLDSRDEDGDDDENSECFLVNSPRKPFSSTPCIGGRRIRKILASKSCKVSPYQNKATVSHCDVSSKYGYYDDSDMRYRLEKNYPIKKRRYFESLSLSDYDDGTNCEAMSGSTQKFIAADDWKLNKGVQPTANNSLVKLRIKSFKVPELFVEMPETATVGSLKRTVMEAVTAILEGGLGIGVLIKGKQIRDDSKTLLQTGISQDILSESLGFCLEPNSSSQTHQFLSPDNSESLLPCSISKSLTRYLPKQSNSVESAMEHSKALVTVPPVVTPGKSKRYESAHRRIRRPFSVAEVEALVGAVEKLGTGRWRDVKTRAFDNSKHRTYVDLKDKWKTLVHTARISPQQRRGEPLPQELLDRVLKAHSYWSPKQ